MRKFFANVTPERQIQQKRKTVYDLSSSDNHNTAPLTERRPVTQHL